MQESGYLPVRQRIARLDQLISATAAEFRLTPHSLRWSLALHLPRLHAEGRWESEKDEANEARRLAARMFSRRSAFLDRFPIPQERVVLDDLQFLPLADSAVETYARPILERFHYLESFREDSQHFALATSPERVAALATVSVMDLSHLSAALGESSHPLRVLSRVYAFDWAPDNSISRLISQITSWFRQHMPEVRGLVTYCNPNVGFTGSSYRASGFHLLARETGTRYAYLDRDYITDRRLSSRAGTVDHEEQRRIFGSRLVLTSCPLEPLELFAIGWSSMESSLKIPQHLLLNRP